MRSRLLIFALFIVCLLAVGLMLAAQRSARQPQANTISYDPVELARIQTISPGATLTTSLKTPVATSPASSVTAPQTTGFLAVEPTAAAATATVTTIAPAAITSTQPGQQPPSQTAPSTRAAIPSTDPDTATISPYSTIMPSSQPEPLTTVATLTPTVVESTKAPAQQSIVRCRWDRWWQRWFNWLLPYWPWDCNRNHPDGQPSPKVSPSPIYRPTPSPTPCYDQWRWWSWGWWNNCQTPSSPSPRASQLPSPSPSPSQKASPSPSPRATSSPKVTPSPQVQDIIRFTLNFDTNPYNPRNFEVEVPDAVLHRAWLYHYDKSSSPRVVSKIARGKLKRHSNGSWYVDFTAGDIGRSGKIPTGSYCVELGFRFKPDGFVYKQGYRAHKYITHTDQHFYGGQAGVFHYQSGSGLQEYFGYNFSEPVPQRRTFCPTNTPIH